MLPLIILAVVSISLYFISSQYVQRPVPYSSVSIPIPLKAGTLIYLKPAGGYATIVFHLNGGGMLSGSWITNRQVAADIGIISVPFVGNQLIPLYQGYRQSVSFSVLLPPNPTANWVLYLYSNSTFELLVTSTFTFSAQV
jgi:hypothetical protein